MIKVDRSKAQLKVFLKFLKYLLPYRKKQIIILILTGLSVLLGLVNPYLSKFIVDSAILNKQLNIFIILGLIGGAVYILNGLIKALTDFLERGIRLKLDFDLKRKLFRHLQGLPLDFFRNKSSGEHLFRLDYDSESVVGLVVSLPGELVNIFPRLLFILLIIFYLDWQMAIFSLLLCPIMYLPIWYLTRRIRKILEEMLVHSEKRFSRLLEAFSHIYLVKALGRERREVRNYLKNLIADIRIRLRNTRLETISSFAGGSFERAITGLITLFGGYQVIRGRLSLGTLTALMMYLNQLIGLQTSIAYFFQRIVLGLVSCQRLDEVLGERAEEFLPKNKEKIILPYASIEFKKVSFGYKEEEYILKDVNFTMEKGFIALVGPSGCGKTTIINLILGLYSVRNGEIAIGGHSIQKLDLCSLKESIGVALQQPYLWNDTIQNNIGYGKENAQKEEIIEVARRCGVDEFVQELPKGYDTVIGEEACKLSEGQKQKIAIARALIKRPRLLILDEAMSSMDSLSEEKIIANIRKIPDIHTVIIVTHRLSTVMACDRAYFLKKPDTMVIEKPQNLIHNDKEFYDLFSAQISSR